MVDSGSLLSCKCILLDTHTKQLEKSLMKISNYAIQRENTQLVEQIKSSKCILGVRGALYGGLVSKDIGTNLRQIEPLDPTL